MVLLQTRIQVVVYCLAYCFRDASGAACPQKSSKNCTILRSIPEPAMPTDQTMIITQLSKNLFVLSLYFQVYMGCHKTFTYSFEYDKYLGHIKLPISELRIERDKAAILRVSQFMYKTMDADKSYLNNTAADVCDDYRCDHEYCAAKNVTHYWLNIFGGNLWSVLKSFDEEKYKLDHQIEEESKEEKVDDKKLLTLREEGPLGEKYKSLRPINTFPAPLIDDIVEIETFNYGMETRNKRLVEQELDYESDFVRGDLRGNPFGKTYAGIII